MMLNPEQKRRIEANKEEAQGKRARREVLDDVIGRAEKTGTVTAQELLLFVRDDAPREIDGERGTGGKDRSQCSCSSWVVTQSGRCRWEKDSSVANCYSGEIIDVAQFRQLIRALLEYHARRAQPQSAEALAHPFGFTQIDQRAAFRGFMELFHGIPNLELFMFGDTEGSKNVRQLGVHSPGQELINSYFPCRKEVVKKGFSAQSRYVQKATREGGLEKIILRCLEYTGEINNESFFDEFLFAEGLWISGFQPLTAAALIKRSLRLNDVQNATFLDLCGGWWGRGFGAVLCSPQVSRIITVDPSSGAIEGSRALWSDLQRWMSEEVVDFQQPIVDVMHMCAEDVDPDSLPAVDVVLTSPPYFDLEKYCKEPTQSFMRFPDYDVWKQHFLGKLLQTAYRS